MHALIIENELDAQELLKNIIDNHISNVSIIGVAGSTKEGIEKIIESKPDLLFLDIDLGDGTGFDVLEATKDYSYKIIFTTAFDEFAIKAFNYNTVHYLLKPYGVSDIKEAIDKISQSDLTMDRSKIDSLLSQMLPDRPKKIAFNTGEGLWMVDANEVIRLEGDGSYTHLHVRGKESVMISKPMGELENRLDPKRFYRVHRSHTVNVDFIDKYMREDGGYLVLLNKEIVPVSRYKKEGLIQFLTGK